MSAPKQLCQVDLKKGLSEKILPISALPDLATLLTHLLTITNGLFHFPVNCISFKPKDVQITVYICMTDIHLEAITAFAFNAT